MEDLTTEQLEILGNWAQALIDITPSLDENALAEMANEFSDPDYWVWRTSVSKHEVTDTTSIHTDGTTVTAFSWGGAQGGYIARSQGERDAWRELFNTGLEIKPYLANVRTAINDIFSGTGAAAVGNRNHLWGISQRKCTVGEKLFVSVTVGGPTQTGSRGAKTNPDTLGPEGDVTPQNIVDALAAIE